MVNGIRKQDMCQSSLTPLRNSQYRRLSIQEGGILPPYFQTNCNLFCRQPTSWTKLNKTTPKSINQPINLTNKQSKRKKKQRNKHNSLWVSPFPSRADILMEIIFRRLLAPLNASVNFITDITNKLQQLLFKFELFSFHHLLRSIYTSLIYRDFRLQEMKT